MEYADAAAAAYLERIDAAAGAVRHAASARGASRRNVATGSASILAGNLFTATFLLGVFYAFAVKLAIPWLKAHSDHAVLLVGAVSAMIFATYGVLIWVEARPRSPTFTAPRITILVGVEDSTLEGRQRASEVLRSHALNGAVVLTRAPLHRGVGRPSVVAEACRTMGLDGICPLRIAFVDEESDEAPPKGTQCFVRPAGGGGDASAAHGGDVPAALGALADQVALLDAVGPHHLQIVALGGGALAAAELDWLLRNIEVTSETGESVERRRGIAFGRWSPCTLSAEVVVAPIPARAREDEAGLAVRAVEELLGVSGTSAAGDAEAAPSPLTDATPFRPSTSRGRLAAASSQLSQRGWRRRLKPLAIASLPASDRRFYVLCRT